MRKHIFVCAILVLLLTLAGCGKEETVVPETTDMAESAGLSEADASTESGEVPESEDAAPEAGMPKDTVSELPEPPADVDSGTEEPAMESSSDTAGETEEAVDLTGETETVYATTRVNVRTAPSLSAEVHAKLGARQTVERLKDEIGRAHV